MNKYYLRFITDTCSDAVEAELSDFLFSSFDAQVESIRPYWKNPGQGELLCRFSSAESPEKIRSVLADNWEGDVADATWSHIHAPHVIFMWVSADHETNF